jgi:hypothetical protein
MPPNGICSHDSLNAGVSCYSRQIIEPDRDCWLLSINLLAILYAEPDRDGLTAVLVDFSYVCCTPICIIDTSCSHFTSLYVDSTRNTLVLMR